DSLVRPPPRPTLFPYTTLFRSLHHGDGRLVGLLAMLMELERGGRVEVVELEEGLGEERERLEPEAGLVGDEGADLALVLGEEGVRVRHGGGAVAAGGRAGEMGVVGGVVHRARREDVRLKYGDTPRRRAGVPPAVRAAGFRIRTSRAGRARLQTIPARLRSTHSAERSAITAASHHATSHSPVSASRPTT